MKDGIQECDMIGCTHTFTYGSPCEGDPSRICTACCVDMFGVSTWRPVYEITELGVLT